MSRHPLYFFSLLGFAGIGFATETVTFGLAFVIAFWLVYPHIIWFVWLVGVIELVEAFHEYGLIVPLIRLP